MDFSLSNEQNDLLNSLNNTIHDYDDNYWLHCDNTSKYPIEFVNTIAEGGWLGIAMPTEFGGSNLGVTEAALMMMLISEKGGMTAASSIHMNIFGPSSIVKFGTKEQKERWLPNIISGKTKMCFAVTEPDTGLDTTRLKTKAERNENYYLINGRKIWTSTAQITNKIMIIARTSKRENGNPTNGLSLFYTDFNRDSIEARIINKMGRAAVDTNELFIDDLKAPIEDIIGEEGKGFSYLIHSLNPERILVAAEAYGIAKNALERAVNYANERSVFDRLIGKNQSIQHPLAEAWAKLESVKLLILKAANLYDNNKSCGVEANAAKFLAAEYGMEICKQAIATHGGMGYAKEYHVERLFREMMIPYLAPVSQQLVLSYIAEKALGLPKSY
ncbi:MAG: Acyl-CoA dehydrogenase fadE12 [Alphaproteobacteria bacterium MarineAlpha9_Bin3]|nr:MAG: Acyl-CoA dehydrogenase fadE12 [Alphaproteobacteria bacterium MarineAlpha9_Bin3]|tara:strand:- start:1113 stop:2273 length:1161 start_codon:yes stop_codon:yes gene_type:complete